MSTIYNTPANRDINLALSRLEKVILDNLDFNSVVQNVVDSIFLELGYMNLGYKIVVLALVDEDRKVLQRISASRTPEGEQGVNSLPMPFSSVDIPLSAKENLCIKVLEEKMPFATHTWSDILTPPLSPDDAVKLQNDIGIKMSIIYPLSVRGKTIGVMIFSMLKSEQEISSEEKELLSRFTDIVGLAVQNSRLYSFVENTTEELKKINGQLKDANERLESLDRLKDEFVSLASHELRTPMTVIKSYIWSLLNTNMGDLNDKQKVYLERTYESTERLINLVNDMLNVSRIESGRFIIEPARMDVSKLVSDVVTEMQSRGQEVGINLVFNGQSQELITNADHDRIKEVIINLIGNSLKFTPKDGLVTASVVDSGDSITVSVKDTGRGISAEDLPKLFQKFNMVGDTHLTKDQGQGTGLGLYISKSIVELHKGKIWVESEGLGKGATFFFSIPKESSAQAADQTNTTSPQMPNHQG